MNLKETGLNRLIKTGFNLLDLITFFTVGPKETRAWTIKNNSTAPEAAGIIHTDFQKGFIRAETISYEDYLNFKSEQAVKDADIQDPEILKAAAESWEISTEFIEELTQHPDVSVANAAKETLKNR